MDVSKWHAVVTPLLSLAKIEKEPGTQGRVFLLKCNDRYGFLSQSLPALVRWLNSQRSDKRKFLVSSFYRVVRLGQRRHLGWTAQSFERSNVTAINAALAPAPLARAEGAAGFEKLVCLTRDPDSWQVNLPEGYARPPAQECESDPGQRDLAGVT